MERFRELQNSIFFRSPVQLHLQRRALALQFRGTVAKAARRLLLVG